MAAICGIDWAAEFHDVRITSAEGEVTERRFCHDEAGIRALLELLCDHEVEVAAIERPDGLLVGRLLAAGIAVMAIHPNQVAAARDRFRAAAGKDDRFDAMVLCELARTDTHRFPILAPCSDETLALRALMRTREDLVDARSPTSCAPTWTPSGPAPSKSSPTSTARSRSPSWSAIPAPTTPAAWAPSACRASSPATPTAVAGPSRTCSPACATRPPRSSANSKTTPAAAACSA
jgi:hypothetical protein